MINFEIAQGDFEKFTKWNNKHKKRCKAPGTTIGGSLTYSFTPTGVGTIIEVKCVCGKKIDLTDVSKW